MLKFNVRCMNKIHKIVLADNYQLHLCNHNKNERADLRALQALGSDYEARCLHIMDYWRKDDLRDDELKTFPDIMARLWKYIHKGSTAFRWTRKWCLKKRSSFFDLSKVEAWPDELNAKTCARKHLHRHALTRIVDTLKARGWSLEGNYNEQVLHGRDYCSYTIPKLANIHVYVKVGSGNGSRAAIEAGSNNPALIINDGIYTEAAADLIELEYMRGQLNSYRIRTGHSTTQINKANKLDNAVERYPLLTTIDTEQKSGYLDALMSMTVACKDTSTANIFVSKLNSIVKELNAQGRLLLTDNEELYRVESVTKEYIKEARERADMLAKRRENNGD